MGKSLTPFENISYELNQLIERRVAERRVMQRDSSDRRRVSEARKKSSEAQQVRPPAETAP